MTERILRVLRGGSWFNGSNSLCASTRIRYRPDKRDFHYGFRLVIVEKDTQVIPESLFEKFRVEAEEHSKDLLRRLAKGSSE